MSIVKDYENYLAKRAEFEKNPMSKYWTKQTERYMEPFRMFGNVYYVGDSWVCVHLIDTGDGLLLIDAGNCGNTAMLMHSIWKAGFNPENVNSFPRSCRSCWRRKIYARYVRHENLYG